MVYGVETRVLNQALRRNQDRFSDDFMFQLTSIEFADMKSRGIISSDGQAL
jgi:hypothetical protein